MPRRSIKAGNPAAPSATPTVPSRHARPKLSLMITATFLPSRCRICSCNRSADASGFFRQQQYRLRTFRGIDIGLVDTGIGDHEAELVLDDQYAGSMPQHPPRLAENDLDQARIFLDLFGQCECLLPGLYGGEIDIAALGLGYHFLRDHDHVPVEERRPVRFGKARISPHRDPLPGSTRGK